MPGWADATERCCRPLPSPALQAEVVQRKSVELFLAFKSAKPGTPVPQASSLRHGVTLSRSLPRINGTSSRLAGQRSISATFLPACLH